MRFVLLCRDILTLVLLALVPTTSHAVVFNADALDPCFKQSNVPSNFSRNTIPVEVHVCEYEYYVHAIFVGDSIDRGNPLVQPATLDIGWDGEFWRGRIKLDQFSNASGFTEVELSGEAQHLYPAPAPIYKFDGINGGGNNDPDLETITTRAGTVTHPDGDLYSIVFSLDEGKALLGSSRSCNAQATCPRGWKVELIGRHGSTNGAEAASPVTVSHIPIPATGILLSAGLVLMSAGRVFRARSSLT